MTREAFLSFAQDFEFEAAWDLFALNIPEQIPRSGAYVLFGDRTLIYPRGESPIFLIGGSDDLRQRVERVRSAVVRAKRPENTQLFPPFIEQAAQWGSNISVLPIKRHPVAEVKFLLLTAFFQRFGSFPAGNTGIRWPAFKRELRKQRKEDDDRPH